MPSIASHFVCAKIVSDKLKISNDDFYKGNILPDIIDLDNSHYKIRGNYYMIPDVDYYRKNFDITQNLEKGYLCHLLLDRYFLEEYVPLNIKNFKKIDLFSEKMLYNDYTNLNVLLINKYNLDLNYINKFMNEFKEPLNSKKYKLNIDSINNLKTDKLKFIELNKFTEFLENISIKIVEELER